MKRQSLNKLGHQTASYGQKKAFKIGIAGIMSFLILAGLLISYSHAKQSQNVSRKECVILLHGLCRSSLSMTLIEHHLRNSGYTVRNIDYASTQKSIAAVVAEDLAAVVSQCEKMGYERIHFVTHSMGGIVVRAYLQDHDLPDGSRIVMLAPPNHGSELIDWAQYHFPSAIAIVGPAANQLGTHRDAFSRRLKPITPAVGVIIGNRSWIPYFSDILPGHDDGIVTVASAKLEEMQDFWVAPCNHTTILLNTKVQHQVDHFLNKGTFNHHMSRLHPLQIRNVPTRTIPSSALDALTRQR